jgi:hypothetical protein
MKNCKRTLETASRPGIKWLWKYQDESFQCPWQPVINSEVEGQSKLQGKDVTVEIQLVEHTHRVLMAYQRH